MGHREDPGAEVSRDWLPSLAADRSFLILVLSVLWAGTCLLVLPNLKGPDVSGLLGRFGFLDYRDTVWVPLRDFLAGHNPFDVGNYAHRHPASQMFPLYTPTYWWLGIPLALLPYPASVTVWAGVLCASLVALIHLGVHLAVPLRSNATLGRRMWLLGSLALLIVSRPVRASLFQGQWSLLCAAGAGVALLAHRGHIKLTVAAMMVALVKPQVGIPVLLIAMATGRVGQAARAVVWSIALAIPFIAVLAWWCGPTNLLNSLVDSLRFGTGPGQLPHDPLNTQVDFAGTLGHLGVDFPGIIQVGVILLLAVVGCATCRRTASSAPSWAWALVASGSCVLILPNMLYGAVALVPAMVMLAGELAYGRGADSWTGLTLTPTRMTRSQIMVAATSGFFVVIAFWLPSSVVAMVGVGTGAYNFLSGLLLFLAWLLAVGACWTTTRARVNRRVRRSGTIRSRRVKGEESVNLRRGSDAVVTTADGEVDGVPTPPRRAAPPGRVARLMSVAVGATPPLVSQLLFSAVSFFSVAAISRQATELQMAAFVATYSIESIAVSYVNARWANLLVFKEAQPPRRGDVRRITKGCVGISLGALVPFVITAVLVGAPGEFAILASIWSAAMLLGDTVRYAASRFLGIRPVLLVGGLHFVAAISVSFLRLGPVVTLGVLASLVVLLAAAFSVALRIGRGEGESLAWTLERPFAKSMATEAILSSASTGLGGAAVATLNPTLAVGLQLGTQVLAMPTNVLTSAASLPLARRLREHLDEHNYPRRLLAVWVGFSALVPIVGFVALEVLHPLIRRLLGGQAPLGYFYLPVVFLQTLAIQPWLPLTMTRRWTHGPKNPRNHAVVTTAVYYLLLIFVAAFSNSPQLTRALLIGVGVALLLSTVLRGALWARQGFPAVKDPVVEAKGPMSGESPTSTMSV